MAVKQLKQPHCNQVRPQAATTTACKLLVFSYLKNSGYPGLVFKGYRQLKIRSGILES